MKPLILTAAVVTALAIGACDKSDASKADKTPSTVATKAKSAPEPPDEVAKATEPPAVARPAANKGTNAPVVAAPAATATQQVPPASATAGLDLAAASAGVLTKDLNLAPTAGPPRSTAGDEGRHPTCVKLLACTHDAVVLAPDSVTSYSVTLESVDSLESAEAAAECSSDLKDVVVILKHGKHAVPKSCQ